MISKRKSVVTGLCHVAQTYIVINLFQKKKDVFSHEDSIFQREMDVFFRIGNMQIIKIKNFCFVFGKNYEKKI